MPRSEIPTIFATGHRPNKVYGLYDHRLWLPAVHYVRDYLLVWPQVSTDVGLDVVSGFALFWDMVVAHAVILARAEGANIRLIAAIPHNAQHKSWSREQQEYYFWLRSHVAPENEHVLYTPTTPRAMNKRNFWMADRGWWCLAFWDRIPHEVAGGGTAHCIGCAEDLDRPITNLYDEVMHIMRQVYLAQA